MEPLLPANCVEEEYLYVAMQRCPCGGTYEHDMQSLSKRGETPCDELKVHCAQCKKPRAFTFDISAFFGDIEKYGKIVRPSRLFDVVEWLSIAALFIRDSEHYATEEKRMMLAEADFCLDQALMFYEKGSDSPKGEISPKADMPVPGAYFHQYEGKIPPGREKLLSKAQLLKLKRRTAPARAQRKEDSGNGDNEEA